MEIQVNPVETEPNLDIDITIRAQPNSYAAIMAVDQNVFKLREGFDLTHRDVAEELKRYDPAEQSPFSSIMRDSKYHFFWQPGAANPHSAFYVRIAYKDFFLDNLFLFCQKSGADLLTNAHVFRHQPTCKL